MIKHYIGGVYKSVLYILDHKKYKNFLKKGLYKYVFPIHTPLFRPKEIDIIDKSFIEKIHIVGINLRAIDYKDSYSLNKFISNILMFKGEDNKFIYIEEVNSMDIQAIERIQFETSMEIPKGLDIKLYNIPLILKEISRIQKKDIGKEEVLIISSDRDNIIKTIDSISNVFNFISLIGLDKDEEDELCSEILKTRGLSIFQPKNLEKNLNRYNIIINLEEEFYIDKNQISQQAIIFDFSLKRIFNSLQNSLVINDINIDISELLKWENEFINSLVPSSLYEGLVDNNEGRFNQIYIKDSFYKVRKHKLFLNV